MTTRDIQEIVQELYGVEVSPQLVSEVTADLDADVTLWRSRSLAAVWPIVYFDGLVVNVRGENGRVSQHTMYVAGHQSRGEEGAAGPVAQPERGRQVLALVPDRFEEPRSERHLRGLHRRPTASLRCNQPPLPLPSVSVRSSVNYYTKPFRSPRHLEVIIPRHHLTSALLAV